MLDTGLSEHTHQQGSVVPQADHLLPDSATPLERALSASDKRLLAAPHDVIRQAWDPDTCPEHLLPYLAQAWSVDEWDPAWSVATKRQVIKDSPEVHRRKGTPGALRRALAATGVAATVREWFQYDGAPYTFRVQVALSSAATWTLDQSRALWRTVLTAKNVRSYLDLITLRRRSQSMPVRVGAGAIHRIRLSTVIAPLTAIQLARPRVRVGAAARLRVRIKTVYLTPWGEAFAPPMDFGAVASPTTRWISFDAGSAQTDLGAL